MSRKTWQWKKQFAIEGKKCAVVRTMNEAFRFMKNKYERERDKEIAIFVSVQYNWMIYIHLKKKDNRKCSHFRAAKCRKEIQMKLKDTILLLRGKKKHTFIAWQLLKLVSIICGRFLRNGLSFKIVRRIRRFALSGCDVIAVRINNKKLICNVIDIHHEREALKRLLLLALLQPLESTFADITKLCILCNTMKTNLINSRVEKWIN